ncbi:hypothetical protein [Wolbachia endosymbiont of Frankliniella intonsa]|uniref:hypothetical protein n=1 Tax=Wolbachia endosymbiont of Frankliniella intonsa TaxID=2902422 RepID=UPI00244EA874|nr:hypothetical protein [Wolbachia endosymbiont of Frankliniella intonsa]WGJ62434.1 hypothetical protein M3L71_02055 [Wolbachia endosymbiont of Frankliniella intonsa]
MPFIPRYFTYSSMTFSPLFSICSFYSGNWYEKNLQNFVDLYSSTSPDLISSMP